MIDSRQQSFKIALQVEDFHQDFTQPKYLILVSLKYIKQCILYTNTARLLKKLNLSKVDRPYLKELEKLVWIDLLILDYFGLLGFNNHAREALMDITDERYDRKSTITTTTTQIPVYTWYEIIGEDGLQVNALLDRTINSSHRINLNSGESLRKGMLNSIKT